MLSFMLNFISFGIFFAFFLLLTYLFTIFAEINNWSYAFCWFCIMVMFLGACSLHHCRSLWLNNQRLWRRKMDSLRCWCLYGDHFWWVIPPESSRAWRGDWLDGQISLTSFPQRLFSPALALLLRESLSLWHNISYYTAIDLFILKRAILFGGFAENDYLRSINKQWRDYEHQDADWHHSKDTAISCHTTGGKGMAVRLFLQRRGTLGQRSGYSRQHRPFCPCRSY